MKRPQIPLRVKLTLTSLAVFLAVQVTVSAGWIAWTWSAEERSLDDQLEGHARSVVNEIVAERASLQPQAEMDRLAARISRSQFFERYFVQVRNATGAVEARSSVDPTLRGVELGTRAPISGIEFSTVPVPLGDGSSARLRVVSAPFRDEAGGSYVLELATRAPITGSLFERILDFLFVSLPIGMSAAGAAAWYLAGRAVAPIQRLTRAAQSVGPEHLDRRFDVAPLDKDTARLQHEINHALERLERGYREQGMFISNISHELKTPIAVLLLQAQVLEESETSRDDWERFRANVEDEMRVLGRLVESFLVLARAGHGEDLVRRERVSINEVVGEAAERLAPLAKQYGVGLVTNLALVGEGEDEPETLGDPELLRTMVENLVRNALRFSPRGESVDLRVDRAPSRVYIRVRDRGPGIPAEYIASIFERFVQAPGPKEMRHGVGLGLAIARKVSELHGGTISVTNRADRGAEFLVELPLRAAGDAEETAADRVDAPRVASAAQ